MNFIRNLSFMILMEIKKTYSGSLLGVFWFFLNPLLYSMVYYLLFDKILQVKFLFKMEKTSYFEYLIIGLILWTSFASGLLKATSSILENAYILKKVFIPAIYFPITSSLIPLIQGIFFLLLILLLEEGFNFILFITFIISMFSFYIFLLGLSLIFSSLSVYIRDIPQFLNNFLNFLFYSVPIIYPYENTPQFFKQILEWNPLFYIFRAVQNVLFYKNVELEILFTASLIGLFTFIVGLFIFNKLREGFYDVL